MQRCHEYVEALEEEQKKIQVFQRELPLCLELVTQGKLIKPKQKKITYLSQNSASILIYFEMFFLFDLF